MRELKYSIDNNGHGLIEMPCGTGKTITILSFLVAYKRKRPDIINKIGQGCGMTQMSDFTWSFECTYSQNAFQMLV